MSTQVGTDQHRRLVNMLEEQLSWATGVGYNEVRFGKNVEWYDPVVVTKAGNVVIGDDCRVDSFVKLEGGNGLVVGRGVHIASFAHINIGGGKTYICDFAAVASGAKIVSGGNRPTGKSMSASAPLSDQVIELQEVLIDAYAVVLTNAIILPRVTLHEGAVAAAGAVVTKDVPAWEIWAGNPARKIADRVVGGEK